MVKQTLTPEQSQLKRIINSLVKATLRHDEALIGLARKLDKDFSKQQKQINNLIESNNNVSERSVSLDGFCYLVKNDERIEGLITNRNVIFRPDAEVLKW